MSKYSLLLARFKSSRSYSRNNKTLKKKTKTTMVVIIAVTTVVTMVAAHGKKFLQNMVNLGQKKRTGALGFGANGTNTRL